MYYENYISAYSAVLDSKYWMDFEKSASALNAPVILMGLISWYCCVDKKKLSKNVLRNLGFGEDRFLLF